MAYFSEVFMKFLFNVFIVFIVVSNILPAKSIAKQGRFVPKPDFVVAQSNHVNTQELSLDDLEQLVNDSQQAGQTEINQGMLKIELKQRYLRDNNPSYGYLYARVLQKEHEFEAAIALSDELLARDPNLINVRLLKANMLMTKGQFQAAKKECLTLLGNASIETVSTCTLDAESQMGGLASSYQGLLNITKNKTQSLPTKHLLAELAFRLNDMPQTIAHLAGIDLGTAPVSMLVLWSDAQLRLNNPDVVIATLSKLLADSTNLEDALLLRLAQAEQALQKNDYQTPRGKELSKWQSLMKKRVVLRERRKDTFHANDLAWYYLTIAQKPQKAFYWAQINWQQARLESDATLLALAKLAVDDQAEQELML
jgi:tetratricopeptide (TPR) repeat protein